MLADRVRLGVQEEGGMICELIDRTAPTLVVNKPYSTAGNGGRKSVRLNNGWLVAVVYDNKLNDGYYYLRVRRSKDKGLTWEEIPITGRTQQHSNYAITTDGVNTFVIWLDGSTTVYTRTVYTSNESMSLSSPMVAVNTGQTGLNEISLTINKKSRELHACWTSKNSTYPNSFNVRYCKGTINADGTVTWGSTEQVSVANTSGDNWFTPCIVLSNNVPNILAISQSNYANYRLYNIRKDLINNKWVYHEIYYGGSYVQFSPSACVDKDEVIHVAWHGRYSANPNYDSIFYSKSLDGGFSWQSRITVMAIGNAHLRYPSIAVNSKNELFVSCNDDPVSTKIFKSNNGELDYWTQLIHTSYTMYPSLLDDCDLDFEEPLSILMSRYDYPTYPNSVIFSGKWYECRPKPTKPDDPLNSIGNKYLIAGDMQAGYFGTVTNLVTNTQLTNLMGMTNGTLLDPADTDITFHKFAHKGRILFIPSKPIKHSISWDNIQSQNGVKGKVISIDGNMYLCRLMTGSRHYYTNNPSIAGGEWEELFVAFHVSNGGILTDSDIYLTGNGNFNWCQEVYFDSINNRIIRGRDNVNYFIQGISNTVHETRGWRPVLEVL
jgi:hypothetical protein